MKQSVDNRERIRINCLIFLQEEADTARSRTPETRGTHTLDAEVAVGGKEVPGVLEGPPQSRVDSD